MGAKHIDPLTTCNLCVEIILLGYLANYYQLIGSDLTTGILGTTE
jgi:hypothetical protein